MREHDAAYAVVERYYADVCCSDDREYYRIVDVGEQLPGYVLGVGKALSQSPGSNASSLDVSRNSCDKAHGKRISSTESCRGGVMHPFTPLPCATPPAACDGPGRRAAQPASTSATVLKNLRLP